MTYDPKSALKNVRQFFRPQVQGSSSIVNSDGNAYVVKQRPQAIAFFLLEWLGGDLNLPEDLKRLPTSSAALKAHVRPDGGAYLGAYAAPNEVGSEVVLFGDPLMERAEAIKTVFAFRRFHAEQHAGKPIRSVLDS